jgi:hypothetical protein
VGSKGYTGLAMKRMRVESAQVFEMPKIRIESTHTEQ